jgi:hypothetical protein
MPEAKITSLENKDILPLEKWPNVIHFHLQY